MLNSIISLLLVREWVFWKAMRTEELVKQEDFWYHKEILNGVNFIKLWKWSTFDIHLQQIQKNLDTK